jgi:hypothetical protein
VSKGFGDLRALLHAPAPNVRSWEALCALLDGMDEAAQQAAIAYAADFMERAPWREVARDAPPAWGAAGSPACALANGLRVASPDALLRALEVCERGALRAVALTGALTERNGVWWPDAPHTLTSAHMDALVALPALTALELWTLEQPDWSLLTSAPLRALRRLVLSSCLMNTDAFITLGRADWPALEYLEYRWRTPDGYIRPSMAQLRAFAQDSALDSLQTLALPDAYIYSDEEEDWVDWGGAVVGRGPGRAWAPEAREALTGRWPHIKLIN